MYHSLSFSSQYSVKKVSTVDAVSSSISVIVSVYQVPSGVHKNKKPIGRECPAYKQDGECGSCRACWNRNIKQVSYKEH